MSVAQGTTPTEPRSNRQNPFRPAPAHALARRLSLNSIQFFSLIFSATFPLQALLPELQGEVVAALPLLSACLLAFTSTSFLAQGTRRRTHKLLELCAQEGEVDLLFTLRREFPYPGFRCQLERLFKV